MRKKQESTGVVKTMAGVFNEKEETFISTFVATLSKTKAGKAAKMANPGISSQEFYNRPHIKEEILKRIKEQTTAPEVNIKRIDEMAKTNINDFMRTRKAVRWVNEKVPLAKVIESVKLKLTIAERVHAKRLAREGGFPTKSAITYSLKNIKELQTEVDDLTEELDINPSAYRIMSVEQWFNEEYLDLAAIRKSGVMIKSYKMTKDGPIIELYDALAASKEIAKISGSYELDNQQKAPNVKLLSFDPLSEVEASEEPNDEDED